MLRTDPSDQTTEPQVCDPNNFDPITFSNTECPAGYTCQSNPTDGPMGEYHCCSDPGSMPGPEPISGEGWELCAMPGSQWQDVIRDENNEPKTCNPAVNPSDACPSGSRCQYTPNENYRYVCCSAPASPPYLPPGPPMPEQNNINLSLDGVICSC